MTTALNGDLGELSGKILCSSKYRAFWLNCDGSYHCLTEFSYWLTFSVQLKKTGWCFVNPCLQARSPGVKHQFLKNMKMNWEKWNVWIMLTIYYQNIFSNIWLARKWQQNEKGQEKQNIKNNKKQRRALTRSESELSSETAHLSKSSWQTLPSEECTVADIFATFFYISTFSTLTP